MIRRALTHLALPLVLASFTALTWGIAALGVAPMLAFGIASTACFATLLGLERALPHRADWNQSDGQLLNDIGHTVIGTAVGARLGQMAAEVVAGGLGVILVARLGHSVWPASWPFAVDLLLVVLLADLGRYAQHRLHHAVPLLWRFHALHHDITKLSAFKNSRSHPVERILQALFMFIPLTLLGAPADAVYWFIVLNSFLGMVDHSNLDARIGIFEWVVNGPMSHRIHHSRDQREGNSNFGSAMVLWDMLFGTWINPLARPPVAVLGIDEPGPVTFVPQLVEPFLPRARANDERRTVPESAA